MDLFFGNVILPFPGSDIFFLYEQSLYDLYFLYTES